MKKAKVFWFIIFICIVAGFVALGIRYCFPPRVFDRTVRSDVLHLGSLSQKVLVGRYKLNVDLYFNPSTTVKYIIPVDENNKPLPSASNVVFYAPFGGDTGENFEKHEWLIPFIVECGYTVFSMSMKRNVQNSSPECFFVFEESGWHDVVEEVKERLVAEYSLKDQPMISVGQSAGGALTQRLLISKPGLIDIAAWGSSGDYTEWQGPPQAAILMVSTWGDGGTQATDLLWKDLRAINGKALRAYTPLLRPRDYHSIGKSAHQLIKFFVRDMVNSRAEHNGIGYEAANGYPGLSSDFYKVWNSLPHEFFGEQAKDYSHLKVLPVVPENPQRVIWIMTDQVNKKIDPGIALEVVWRMLTPNSIVIYNQFGQEQYDNPQMVDDVLAKILSVNEWRDLLLYVLGDGLGGQAVAVAALKSQNDRIRRIITLDSIYQFEPNEALSIAAHIRGNRIPFSICFSQYNFELLPDSPAIAEEVYLDGERTMLGVWEKLLNRFFFNEENSNSEIPSIAPVEEGAARQ